ncbi:MAG: hypothetical protein V4667_13185 [Bacteroidota bacterium]
MKKAERPLLVTIACVIAFVGYIVMFPSIFSPFVKKLGDWYPAIFGSLIAAHFIAVVGVWFMKKWGVFLFFVSILISQSIHLLADNWSGASLILPILFLGSTIFYYSKMDRNL